MPTLEEDAEINAGIAQDPDNPEWTAEDFANARPASEVLPKDVVEGLVRPRGRPPGPNPAKVLVSVRVRPDVLARLRASGAGWQTRVSEALTQLADEGRLTRAGQFDEVPDPDIEATDMDGRHRDKDSEFSRKHGNSLIGTLRATYGQNFAKGIRADAKLSNVLDRLDKPSLSQLHGKSAKV